MPHVHSFSNTSVIIVNTMFSSPDLQIGTELHRTWFNQKVRHFEKIQFTTSTHKKTEMVYQYKYSKAPHTISPDSTMSITSRLFLNFKETSISLSGVTHLIFKAQSNFSNAK